MKPLQGPTRPGNNETYPPSAGLDAEGRDGGTLDLACAKPRLRKPFAAGRRFGEGRPLFVEDFSENFLQKTGGG